MARTLGHGSNGQPVTGPDAEWWGKRPLAGIPRGGRSNGFWKRRLHRLERRMAAHDIEERRRALEDSPLW